MDRIIKGLIAGTLGAFVMNIWDFFSFYVLRFHDHLYLEWASVLVYGHKPENLLEYIFSLIAQTSWAGLLGVIFASLIPYAVSKQYLIIGAFYGHILTFILFAISQLFKVPGLTDFDTTTAISHSMGAVVWGLALSKTLIWLDLTPKSEI